MLEEANRTLTGRLNLTRGELESAVRDRNELNQRFQSTLSEIDALNSQLAARPEPQEAATGWTAVPGGAMIAIEGQVLFEPGKITLRDEARAMLDAVRSTLEGEYSNKDVLVFGHTDDRPIKKSGWADNYQLSTERALAVVRYLSGQGVSAKRLVACGCGEHRPRAANTSQANRAMNRRVEIYALDPQAYGLQP
jgi:chemotaxis protein MotB